MNETPPKTFTKEQLAVARRCVEIAEERYGVLEAGSAEYTRKGWHGLAQMYRSGAAECMWVADAIRREFGLEGGE